MRNQLKNQLKDQLKEILLLLRKRREELGISQDKMGRKIGIQQNSYFKLEKGDTKLDMLRFLQITTILDLDPVEIITKSKIAFKK